jgi:hypothetical protein
MASPSNGGSEEEIPEAEDVGEPVMEAPMQVVPIEATGGLSGGQRGVVLAIPVPPQPPPMPPQPRGPERAALEARFVYTEGPGIDTMGLEVRELWTRCTGVLTRMTWRASGLPWKTRYMG